MGENKKEKEMKSVNPSFEILTKINGESFLKDIEKTARVCYKSEDLITEDSAKKLVATLIKNGHEAMIEHAPAISVKFTANRGFTHELVRMRLSSFAQESTRYVNYAKGKFGSEITTLTPQYIRDLDPADIRTMIDAWLACEEAYLKLIENGVKAQIARDALPIGTKADIVMTCNVRQWRHILKLRTESVAHPIMLEIMRPLLKEFQSLIPIIFDDITY